MKLSCECEFHFVCEMSFSDETMLQVGVSLCCNSLHVFKDLKFPFILYLQTRDRRFHRNRS